jgi:ParB family chromosome partitioning protein
VETIQVDKLIPHSRNNEFFDDIQGDNWKEFLESVKTSGVIEPIVISQDKIIVSGHQRVRACKELNIAEIPCRIKIYDKTEKWSKDDLIVKELLETNLRQRGIGNLNGIKFARCIVELERLYGIKNGGDRKSDTDNLDVKTQKQLAEDLGISQEQLRSYKKLLQLIPDFQDLVESDKLSATTAYKVYAKLSSDEQKKLLLDLGVEKISKMTKSQAEKEVEKLLEENENLKANERKWYEEAQKTKEELSKVKKQKQEVKEVEKVVEKIIEKPVEKIIEKEVRVEVIPEDYEQLKHDYQELKRNYDLIQYENEFPTVEKKYDLGITHFRGLLSIFGQQLGDYVYSDTFFNQITADEKNQFLSEIEEFKLFIGMLEANINNSKNVKEVA